MDQAWFVNRILPKNFKYAVLEAFISVEIVIVNYLRTVKLKKDVSRSKLKDFAEEVGIGYMLNIELPMLASNLTREERQILGDVDRVRKIRNEIVHEGRRATEKDSQFAVNSADKLHGLVQKWMSEIEKQGG